MENVRGDYLLDQQIANRLLAEKRRAQEGEDSISNPENGLDNDYEDELDNPVNENESNSENKENDKKLSARKEMRARIIERKIKKERFDGLPFYSALMLAIFKDIIDFITLGTMGAFVGIFVDGMIGIILLLNGSSKVEVKIKRAIYINLIEKIPILNILPLGTGFIIYIKIQQNNKVAELQQKLRKLRK